MFFRWYFQHFFVDCLPRSRLRNAFCRCGRCGHPALPPVGVNQKGAGKNLGLKGGTTRFWRLEKLRCSRCWSTETGKNAVQLLGEKWPKQLGPVYFSKTVFWNSHFCSPRFFWGKKGDFSHAFQTKKLGIRYHQIRHPLLGFGSFGDV